MNSRHCSDWRKTQKFTAEKFEALAFQTESV